MNTIEIFRYNLTEQSIRWLENPDSFNSGAGVDFRAEEFIERLMEKSTISLKFQEKIKECFLLLEQGDSMASCQFEREVSGTRQWTKLTLQKLEEPWAIGLLEDVTEWKEFYLQNVIEARFYQALLAEKDAYGKVDLTEDRILLTGGMWNLYNEIIHKVTFSGLFGEFVNKVVHPEDREEYAAVMDRGNLIAAMEEGRCAHTFQFRRILDLNKMVWMSLTIHLIKDPHKQHVMGLLFLKNIDQEKRYQLQLHHESQRDALTGFYNKKAMPQMISDYLQQAAETENCALMILDIDNFKMINDCQGHQQGDCMLEALADTIRTVFRKEDIVGRFGGDEFVIFIKNVGQGDWLKNRLETLYDASRSGFIPFCSIGVALFPGNESYERAFRKADVALYAAKNSGKGRYVFYHALSVQAEEGNQDNQHGVLQEETETVVNVEQNGYATIANVADEPHKNLPDFLMEHGDMAYIIREGDFRFLCGNRAFFDRLGITEADANGKCCYELLYKRTSPCPFCSKANWSTDKFFLWKNYNPVLEQEFLIKSKRIQWKGKDSVLTFAVDVSNDKTIVDSMGKQSDEAIRILGGVEHMFEASDLQQAMEAAFESIACFFGAERVILWQSNKGEYDYQFSWDSRKGSLERQQNYEKKLLRNWIKALPKDEAVQIEHKGDMLSRSYEMYEWMNQQRICNQKWKPISYKGTGMGWLQIDNISANISNTVFLDSFSNFIAAELIRRKGGE